MLTAIDRTESQSDGASQAVRADRNGEPIACVEPDRFCEGCAYNLWTLPVYRDEKTGIPIVQCTECGKHQSANDTATILRPWLHRFTSLVIGGWVITMLAVFFWMGMALVAINYATLDELTIRSGTQIQRIGNTTIRTVRGSGPLEVWTDMPDYNLFITAILVGSGSVALSLALLLVVVAPHWPRKAYYAVMLVMPLITGAIAALVWRVEAPHLFGWSLSYVAAHVGANVLGGFCGVAFGRPLARLAVRIFIPPTLRPRLAYLWMVDGKSPPAR